MRLKEYDVKSKPKFDKEKCLKCKYRNTYSQLGYSVRHTGKVVRVLCDYAVLTGVTCLKPDSNNTVVDMRGEDYNNCMLFSEGDRLEKDKTQLIIGSAKYEDREQQNS